MSTLIAVAIVVVAWLLVFFVLWRLDTRRFARERAERLAHYNVTHPDWRTTMPRASSYPNNFGPQFTKQVLITEREGASLLWLIDFVLDPRGRQPLRGTNWIPHLESLEAKLQEMGYENPYQHSVPRSAR